MPRTDLPTLPPVGDDDSRDAASPPPGEEATVESARRREVDTGARRRPPRSPRPDPALPDPERRPGTAGHGLVTCVLALGLALLFTAPGAHKRAYNEPSGWRRDVALAVTGPLDWMSGALLLDRPRAAVQALAGRSGTDDIDTSIVIDDGAGPATDPSRAGGASSPPPTAPPSSTPTRQAFSPQRKLRIWVAGDSLVVTPGYAIVRATGASAAMKALGVDGRVATGLTRPDVFNWFEHVRSQVQKLVPNVVVLGFGGNDDKAYMTGLPDGVRIGGFGDAAWRKEYRRRVATLFDAIDRAGGYAVWIGLPQTRDAEQTQRFDVVNAVVAAEARKRPDSVAYIDTYLLFAGPDGGYTDYLTRPAGGDVRVREGDGVHFTRDGGDVIAREVLRALNQRFDLTSWKRKARSS